MPVVALTLPEIVSLLHLQGFLFFLLHIIFLVLFLFFARSFVVGRLLLCDSTAVEMSFPQLGYPQYLSASQAVYGSDRPGVLTPSSRGGSTEIGGSPSATAAAVTSVLGMYASPYAHNYSAFLPYTSADLALFSQMVSAFHVQSAQMIV